MALKRYLTPWQKHQEVETDDSDLHPIARLHNEIDSLFDSFFRRKNFESGEGSERAIVSPKTDVAETEKEYHVSMELPGIDEKELEVTLEHGVLTISGEKKAKKEEKDKKYHRIERNYGAFLRSFSLPDNIDENKVKASFKNGVLHIDIPKSEKHKETARRIKIND